MILLPRNLLLSVDVVMMLLFQTHRLSARNIAMADGTGLSPPSVMVIVDLPLLTVVVTGNTPVHRSDVVIVVGPSHVTALHLFDRLAR